MVVDQNKSNRISPTKYWDKFRFKLKRHFVEVLKTKNTDKAVAKGYALGTFISVLPTPGFSAILAILMVAIFKRINKIAVFISMAIWNIWTVMPIYWVSKKLGDFIFGDAQVVMFEIDSVNLAFQYTLRFVVGNLIILIPFSIANYYLALWILKRVRGRREVKSDLRDKRRLQ